MSDCHCAKSHPAVVRLCELLLAFPARCVSLFVLRVDCLCLCDFGPGVVRLCEHSPHPQGLQGSHLILSQTSAQRHRTYFLLENKAVNEQTG